MRLRARLRRWYWRHIRRHSGEVCHSCGVAIAKSCPTYWFAPNWLWNRVIGSENGLRCIACFTRDCETAGIPVGWTCGPIGDIEDWSEHSKPRTEPRPLPASPPRKPPPPAPPATEPKQPRRRRPRPSRSTPRKS